MFAGPVFQREFTIAPRRSWFYWARAVYVGALAAVLGTGWSVLAGTQEIHGLGDTARFGGMMFQLLAPLQLGLTLFFSALFSASSVSLEKDRKTFELLLLTDLSNSQLVLGRLFASLLTVAVLLVAGIPFFVLLMLFGGVTLPQIGRVYAVSVASALVAGSLGSTLALWREKTFQTLATTILALVFWVVACGSVWLGMWGETLLGFPCRSWAAAVSPWAVVEAAKAFPAEQVELFGFSPSAAFLAFAAVFAVALNGLSVWRVRRWNPNQEAQPRHDPAEESADAAAPRAARRQRKIRAVWNRPILWREMKTAAYGRRVFVVRLAFAVMFALAAFGLHESAHSEAGLSRQGGAMIFAPLVVLSLVLINTQAVTAITSERDAKAIDLLLVTDVTPREFILSKLLGVLYNTKEMALLPALLCGWMYYSRAATLENALALGLGIAVLDIFVAMLGLHVGTSYANSRSAILISLGTVLFLSVGVAVCMWILVSFSGSFEVQLAPFALMLGGGSVGLYAALGIRNPSPAMALGAFVCPLAAFWGITSVLQGQNLSVLLIVGLAYGWMTLAMWKPAVNEYNIAMGHSSQAEG